MECTENKVDANVIVEILTLADTLNTVLQDSLDVGLSAKMCVNIAEAMYNDGIRQY